MALFDSLSQVLTDMIRSKASRNNSAIIEGIKDASTRPANLDKDGGMRRDYFEGHHKEHFKSFLRTIYPEAMLKGEIHPVTVNYVRTQAETDADIYRTGEPLRIASTEAATQRLANLTAQARTATVLPETEVRSIVGREHFMRVQRNPSTERLEITRHWAQNVWPVVDPSAPTELQCCSAVMLQIADDTYELWTAHEDEAGRYWDAVQISEAADRPSFKQILSGPYRGRLPILAMYVSTPDSSPFLTDDGDLIDQANNYMLAWTDVFHLTRKQGHSPIWYSGTDDNASFNGGPGGITNLGDNGQMGALQVNAQIEESRNLLNDFSGAIARSRTQSPRAYVTNPQPLNSGVALRVDNQLTEEKRPQRVELMRQFEVNDLLPILDEVDRLQPAETNPITQVAIDFLTLRVVFPTAPTIEDVSQKQNRLIQAIQAGLMTRERAAVEAGIYEDEDTAAEAIKNLEPMDNVQPTEQPPERGPTASSSEQP